jgi:hypothetical protein
MSADGDVSSDDDLCSDIGEDGYYCYDRQVGVDCGMLCPNHRPGC